LENTEENSKKIGKIWMKAKLNSDKIEKIWKKPKLNSGKIWKIFIITLFISIITFLTIVCYHHHPLFFRIFPLF
jgi:hypothetical protein